MNIIWAIRELCKGENGIENLFDFNKTYEKLIDLSDNKQEATQFAAMLYGGAREKVLELIHNAYKYKDYLADIESSLIKGGMYESEAKRTIEIFLEVFAFPGYREVDESKIQKIVTEEGDFRTEYIGEVKDGKEHGVGKKTLYYQGEWCNYYETVWIYGIMYGYEFGKEMEFGMYEDKKIGFVANNCLIGKTRIFASSGEEFNDLGKNINIK